MHELIQAGLPNPKLLSDTGGHGGQLGKLPLEENALS
jgi:hypothetical protein